MKRIEQQQKVYEAKSAEEAVAIVEKLLTKGSWDGEKVPDNILAIQIAPHEEVGVRIAGGAMVLVVYVTLEGE